MKILILLIIALPFGAMAEEAITTNAPKVSKKSEIYFGPVIGSSTTSRSAGSGEMEWGDFWGAEAMWMKDIFGVGLSYHSTRWPSGGNQAINVGRQEKLVSFKGMVTPWDVRFKPYAMLGAGLLTENVSTSVQNVSELQSSTTLSPLVGIGVFGSIYKAFGVNFAINYHYATGSHVISPSLSLGAIIPVSF